MRKGYILDQRDLVEIYESRVNGARRIKNVFPEELKKLDKKIAALQKQRTDLIRERSDADAVIQEYKILHCKQQTKVVALKNPLYQKFLELKENKEKMEREK